MVCQVCGSPVAGGFCSNCGARVQAPAPAAMYGIPPPIMFVPRVQRHLQTLGILWCVYGAYRALVGVAGALFLFGISSGRFGGSIDRWGGQGMFPFAPQAWMAGLGTFIAVLMLCLSALSFAVGFSLMARKPWGRTLAIVVAILSLIKVPMGTALGIYTLWVLAPAASGMEYDSIADRS
jgi:hypothetical protein